MYLKHLRMYVHIHTYVISVHTHINEDFFNVILMTTLASAFLVPSLMSYSMNVHSLYM